MALSAEGGPEETDLTYNVKMISVHFTRWGKLLVILANPDLLPTMLDSKVTLEKFYWEKKSPGN